MMGESKESKQVDAIFQDVERKFKPELVQGIKEAKRRAARLEEINRGYEELYRDRELGEVWYEPDYPQQEPTKPKVDSNMLYLLSKIIPVPMYSEYRLGGQPVASLWWQWRDRVFAHRVFLRYDLGGKV